MQPVLDQAIALHAAGNLTQAAATCQALLFQAPHEHRALHLLGIVAYQQGRLAEAIAWIAEAAAACPSEATYLSDLGELHRLNGKPAEAARRCRTALALQPIFPDAQNNLGLALQALDRPDEAEEAFRTAIKQAPNFALAWNNLANLLRELDRTDDAIIAFRQALTIQPDQIQARLNLGQLLLEQENRHLLEEALAHCRRAVELAPNLAEAHNNLGNVLRARGQFAEAEACYRWGLQLAPGLAMTRNNMGQACEEQGRFDEAEAWYRSAIQAAPRNGRFHANLASLRVEQERLDEAVELYQTALRVDPRYVEAEAGLGSALVDREQWEEARRCFEECLERKPSLAEAHAGLGQLHGHFGRFDEAEACYREALRHRPESVAALSGLANIRGGKLPDADRETMEDLLQDDTLTEAKRNRLHFALAVVLDAKGEYEAAGRHLDDANRSRLSQDRLKARGYDLTAHSRFVDRLIETYTPEYFERVAGWGVETPRPVFILGMPRSGTTLTEQILASHPDVHGAGELPLIREAFEGLPDRRPVVATTPLDRTVELTAPAVREAAQRVLGKLAQMEGERARITDKMPDNYLYVGFIATLFPLATIIHCRRDLRDVAVSCWLTGFQSIRWASDQDHLAGRIREYHRLMAHWRRLLPERMVEIDYETTVADLETTARRLIDAVGLQWDPACLAFHENKRPIRTASLAQVRRPIYTQSVGRWRHYTDALSSVFRGVDDLDSGSTDASRRVA